MAKARRQMGAYFGGRIKRVHWQMRKEWYKEPSSRIPKHMDGIWARASVVCGAVYWNEESLERNRFGDKRTNRALGGRGYTFSEIPIKYPTRNTDWLGIKETEAQGSLSGCINKCESQNPSENTWIYRNGWAHLTRNYRRKKRGQRKQWKTERSCKEGKRVLERSST